MITQYNKRILDVFSTALIVGLTGALLSLGGCRAMEGLGEDIEATGEEIKEESREEQREDAWDDRYED